MLLSAADPPAAAPWGAAQPHGCQRCHRQVSSVCLLKSIGPISDGRPGLHADRWQSSSAGSMLSAMRPGMNSQQSRQSWRSMGKLSRAWMCTPSRLATWRLLKTG